MTDVKFVFTQVHQSAFIYRRSTQREFPDTVFLARFTKLLNDKYCMVSQKNLDIGKERN